MAQFVSVNFLPARVECERRVDGVRVLRSPEPLGRYAGKIGEHLERWAMNRPEAVFLAERDGEGWDRLVYGEARRRVRAIGTALLQRRLSVERPVAILSENSIAHALLALAAMHVGVPVAPISPPYSLMSRDHAKLRSIFALLTPGLVFVDRPERFESALRALGDFSFELVSLDRDHPGSTPFDALLGHEDEAGVDAAFAAVTHDTIAKFLLTSGSTGEPKAVINTQRMLCSNQQTLGQAWPFLREEPPVLVDWLPWNHTAGGNNNFGVALVNGGSFYIDDGRPVPGMIERSVRNLREIGPTLYSSVPRGYEALLPFLESDGQLRSNFFSRLKVMQYAGAALPKSIWERIDRVAVEATGRRVHMTSGWGATETAPQVTLVHFEPVRSSVIGLPTPGNIVKMVPGAVPARYELRVRGPTVTPAYSKRPDLTADAFDDEGFYRMGDAGCFADENAPEKGIEFVGRVAEEFKLTSGVWVQTGLLRVRAIVALAPVAQDVVIAGHGQDEIRFLVFPAIAACRALCPELGESAPIASIIADERVRGWIREGLARLRAEGGGSSTFATAAILLTEPPSIDAGEITDKGYINQRAVLERRAELVAELYAEPAGLGLIRQEQGIC